MSHVDGIGNINASEKSTALTDDGKKAERNLFSVDLNFKRSSSTSLPAVCYALAHNRIPVINSMSIRSLGHSPARKITVTVASEWAANDRSPFKEVEFVVDAPTPGSAVELAPVHQIQLSDVALAELEEMAPATLILRLADDHGGSQEFRWDVEVYARDQWLGDPSFAVVTAAFIQPNHPDVNKVLARAAQILESMRTPGLSGYQAAQSGQHHRIAQAVFLALQEFIKSYVNPPASFATLGQKLRPIDRVLEERQGTCIDLACAYASCLEQAGLNPVVFFVRNHAFAGYITDDVSLNSSVITAWTAIKSLLDSKLIVGVETVCIPNGASFEEAILATQQNFNEAMMESVLDVSKARREGVRPIPARIVRDNVVTVVIDNGPSSPPIIERRDPTTRKLLAESIPARVQAWKNSLLDLSFRNRLLNLRPERHGIGLVPPIGALGWIEDQLNDGSPFIIHAHDELNAIQREIAGDGLARSLPADQLVEIAKSERLIFASVDAKRFKSVVTRLRSESRLQEEESGANSLYLTLGSVTWGPKYGDYSAPVFLVPIRVAKLRGLSAAVIEMDATQTSSVNYCLIEALRLREQLSLQWFGDDMSDELGLNIEAGLEALRKEFREKGLDQNGFSVDQTASIALLDFEKFRLWKDLTDHWKEFMESPVVRHLVETPRETYKDPATDAVNSLKVSDTAIICAQPADGSQVAAIERALVGSSFVLQGPPGSGKSQTITNLLANAMNRGKKVLFVAEKQAALQEVQERLEAVKLGPYCLVLHDSGTKPDKLREQLRDALDQKPKLDEATHANFEQRFEAAVHQLDEYRRSVYEPNSAGFSFARAYFRLRELGDGPIVEVPRPILEMDSAFVADLQRGLLEIDDITRPARVRQGHPWGLVGDISFDGLDRSSLGTELSSALAACATLWQWGESIFGDALRRAQSVVEISILADLVELKELGQLPSAVEWQAIVKPDWRSQVEEIANDCELALTRVASDVVGNEKFLRRPDLDQFVGMVGDAAESFALGRKKRVREALGPFAEIVDGDSIEPDVVAAKVKRVAEASSHLRALTASLIEIQGLAPLLREPVVSRGEVEAVRRRADQLAGIASVLVASGDFAAEVRLKSSSVDLVPPGLSTSIRVAGESLGALFRRLAVSTYSVGRWCGDVGLVEAVHVRSRETWEEAVRSGTYLSLQRWMLLKATLTRYLSAGLLSMCESIEDGVLRAEDASVAFERGLLMTTLQVRAEETNLDVFDSVAHNAKVARFIELLDERRQRGQLVIPYFLFKSRTINSGVTTGKVGEFRKEVNTPAKRRRGKSIRFLIEKYPEIISDLTPCFLMSPDSVAQFLPPGKIKFDIVVFDEASQIVVADSIGAMGRANSCVIVGDSKQMPPTKFGVVGSAEDDASETESDIGLEEEESILEEAVTAGFHQELLTWHYRSQDESLIAFSNEHYYDRRLSTFPAPVEFRPDCGVFYRRVDGQFDHGKTRTNAIEASAIIEELVRRLDDPATSTLSYGIVTLNIQQRDLIIELLDKHPHPMVQELRETEDKKRRLFVLNLENVQGRERDVIILGTGFSKRVGGGSMPLNFGPLTNAGGEKRLNVAVTRAKRQLVVVSSFDPEEMSAAKSLGMVHLREYLSSARRRENREMSSASGASPASPQIALIAERLRARGVKVETGRGLSNFKIDLALSLPESGDEWLVAVLFDGEEWSERRLAIDRDALPVMILENVMGWRRVARVWMPSLRLEIDSVVDELVEQVNLAKESPKIVPAAPPARSVSASDTSRQVGGSSESIAVVKDDDVALPKSPETQKELLPNQVEFNEYRFPPVPYDSSALLTTYAQGLVESLVDTEGPMPAVVAIKRVAYEFGLQRVRDTKVMELLPLLSTRQVTDVLDDIFVWPKGVDPVEWRGFRKTDKQQRKLEEVSPYEVVNAMEVTVGRSITISVEELVRWTGDFFGAGRITERIADYLSNCIEWSVDTGRFTRDGDSLRIGK